MEDYNTNTTYHNPDDYWYKSSDYTVPTLDMTKGCFYKLLVILIIIIASLFFTGCKMQYVPVETLKTEYLNHTDTVKTVDTLFSEKETIIKEADSSIIAELGLQLKDNEKAILILQRELKRQVNKQSQHTTDTVIKTEEVQVPYPIERKLTKWEKVKMDTGGIAIGFCLLLIIVIVVYLVRAFRKK